MQFEDLPKFEEYEALFRQMENRLKRAYEEHDDAIERAKQTLTGDVLKKAKADARDRLKLELEQFGRVKGAINEFLNGE